MDVVAPRTSVCIGETVHYTVTVNRTPADGPLTPQPIAGVTVEAYVDDPGLGSITGAGKGGSARQQTGFNADDVYGVEFEFKAGKKAGKTTLQFQGLVGGVAAKAGYVSFPVGIEIKQCKYRVSSVTRFPPNGRDNPDIIYPPIVVVMKPTIVAADADGNFSGTGTAIWIGSGYSSGCSVRQAFGDPSPVVINGGLIDGQLVLHFTYQPVGSASVTTCGPITNAAPFLNYTLDPTDAVTVPAGGTVKETQTYGDPTLPGKVTITVTPVK